MAKSSTSNSKVSGKIRFIMLEADLDDGNITEIAQAISNAVRPTIVQQVIQQSAVPKSIVAPTKSSSANTDERIDDELEDQETVVIETDSSISAKKKGSRERSQFKGEIIDSIDWAGGGNAFIEYMRTANPQDTTKKYLLIAAWYKRHGGHEAINANLIYNAYRKMGWQVQADPSQPLRDGTKSERGYYRSEGRGLYAITSIGLDNADKVGSEKSDNS